MLGRESVECGVLNGECGANSRRGVGFTHFAFPTHHSAFELVVLDGNAPSSSGYQPDALLLSYRTVAAPLQFCGDRRQNRGVKDNRTRHSTPLRIQSGGSRRSCSPHHAVQSVFKTVPARLSGSASKMVPAEGLSPSSPTFVSSHSGN